MRITISILLASAAMADMPGTFQATGNMTVDRFAHTATLLPNGKVLIAGGMSAGATAELYDPATRTFTRTADMTASRRPHCDLAFRRQGADCWRRQRGQHC